MNLPTVRQLRYFAALVEEGHFGRAAAASSVSQSAFSTAIKELEALLGIRLVDRTNRQVTFTAAGQKIASQARLCLRDLEVLVETAKGQREPLGGELHLGVIPTIAPFLLPKMLPKLRRAHPKLRLFLTEDQTERLHTKLLDGDLDVVTANSSSVADVSVLLNNGDGTFAIQVSYRAGHPPDALAIGDLDGGGDLALASSNRVMSAFSLPPLLC